MNVCFLEHLLITNTKNDARKYTYLSQGNLIRVREKSGNCQGILVCSNCGHPVTIM